MLKLVYAVHSVTRAKFAVQADVAGRKIEAEIPGLVIEAVSDDGSMGHSFKVIPDSTESLEQAEAEFVVGGTIEVTLAGTPPVAEEPITERSGLEAEEPLP